MKFGGATAPSGSLGLIVRRGPNQIIEGTEWPCTLKLREIVRHGLPQHGLDPEVNEWRRRNARHLQRRVKKVVAAKLLGLPSFYGALFLEKYDARRGEVLPLGLASVAVVTTAGVNFIVDAFQNSVELEAMNFHGFGTGSGAEAIGNTALGTELTTQYATDNTRPTGTQSENGANVYRTVATLDPDADVAITEHGIFSQAATGGGVLLDRTLFSAVNLGGAAGDTLQATYDFTVTAGS